MIPYDRVRDAFYEIADDVETEQRHDGTAFRHGASKGKPFDFAILKRMGTNEAFVRLTRVRIRNYPKQSLSDTDEAVQVPIQNIEGLDILLALARYSLSLNQWIVVDSTSPRELVRVFCSGQADWSVFPNAAC